MNEWQCHGRFNKIIQTKRKVEFLGKRKVKLLIKLLIKLDINRLGSRGCLSRPTGRAPTE
ncbi:hypothetical protein HY546_01185 [archaeon]|nr:hypothetical protein [archaeon]